jgi:hypothetical protein
VLLRLELSETTWEDVKVKNEKLNQRGYELCPGSKFFIKGFEALSPVNLR